MPYPHDPLVLGVDLDGVCADFIGRMREIAAQYYERPLEEFPVTVSYSLREWGIPSEKHYESLHRFAVTQCALFTTQPMIPGARRYLRKLADDGVRIRIIPNRLEIPYFHSQAIQQTIEWLDPHGIPYSDLCLLTPKDQIGADIYIEDSPKNVLKLRNAGLHTVCFLNSTNSEIPAPRAASWEEVYRLVTARMAELRTLPGPAQPDVPRQST